MRGGRIIPVRLLLPPTLYHPSGSERKEKSKSIKKLPIHLQAKMNESKNHKIGEADQRFPSDLRKRCRRRPNLPSCCPTGAELSRSRLDIRNWNLLISRPTELPEPEPEPTPESRLPPCFCPVKKKEILITTTNRYDDWAEITAARLISAI